MLISTIKCTFQQQLLIQLVFTYQQYVARNRPLREIEKERVTDIDRKRGKYLYI